MYSYLFSFCFCFINSFSCQCFFKLNLHIIQYNNTKTKTIDFTVNVLFKTDYIYDFNTNAGSLENIENTKLTLSKIQTTCTYIYI